MIASRTNIAKNFERSSGVLLHPGSLPFGRLGNDARRFIDWLALAGQRWWQILPLGPPDRYGSPYATASVFAGSPLLLAKPDAKVTTSELEQFVAEQHYWAAGWAHFRGRHALEDQVRFQREWDAVHRHAAERGIRILGDIAFYGARQSADHCEHPELFEDNRSAGVPPDDWSKTGQLWGNPTYNWAAMRRSGYRWWIERFRRTLQLVDAIRIDHFRGFVAYWSVPSDAQTAELGAWHPTPGRELFEAIHKELGPLPLVAENLGLITPAVERLRQHLQIPGTVVLQFLFSESLVSKPRNAWGTDNVVYTGTHDNDTILGWWRAASDQQRELVRRALAASAIEEPEPHWKLVRLALNHPAALCILPLQDVLGLGSSARLNHPGRTRGNWKWQLGPTMLTKDLARRLRDATDSSLRSPPDGPVRPEERA